MKRITVLLVAILLGMAGRAYGLYSVSNRGEWPESWPEELAPLREQARTLVGPLLPQRHYAIPFAARERFESAWPHILKVKSEGAPIVLVKGENFFLGDGRNAGVVIHCPPAGQAEKPAAPLPGATDARQRWMNSTYIELVVDGAIVDLNRIPLPVDTLVVDERFDTANKTAPEATDAATLSLYRQYIARAGNFGIDGSLFRHPRVRVADGSLRANCDAALQDLTGMKADNDRRPPDWDTWWREDAASFTPRSVGLKP
ncbi:MAG: hypothetical protein KY475_07070 [Planctomycetes bacterium]|nr:hypothetical protein [Planctomycetota bacterium]